MLKGVEALNSGVYNIIDLRIAEEYYLTIPENSDEHAEIVENEQVASAHFPV